MGMSFLDPKRVPSKKTHPYMKPWPCWTLYCKRLTSNRITKGELTHKLGVIYQGFKDGHIHSLGPPVVPFTPFLGEGSPTKIDYRKKGTLILNSLLEDLVKSLKCDCDSPVVRCPFG